MVRFFTSDGGVVSVPFTFARTGQREAETARRRAAAPLPTAEQQGLCIGSVFSISATNGVDATRRINLLGFCQSVDFLGETVELCVLGRGGEIFESECQLKR